MPSLLFEPPLVLASGSPRRRELLARAGVPFEPRAADVDEAPRPEESPERLVVRLAREKARTVAARLGAPPCRLVLGADTVVVLGTAVLGKPRDREHALALLEQLAGRRHRVLTGIALTDTAGRTAAARVVESVVHMRASTREELRAYVATGEPLDKAGAYAAQGEGRRLITRLDGSESNVIGLPLDETLALLRRAGFRWEHAA